jgi:hypothetical protein
VAQKGQDILHLLAYAFTILSVNYGRSYLIKSTPGFRRRADAGERQEVERPRASALLAAEGRVPRGVRLQHCRRARSPGAYPTRS